MLLLEFNGTGVHSHDFLKYDFPKSLMSAHSSYFRDDEDAGWNMEIRCSHYKLSFVFQFNDSPGHTAHNLASG